MSGPTYGNNEHTVAEQNQSFLEYLFGNYEVQTHDVTTTETLTTQVLDSTDTVIQLTTTTVTTTTIVPDGLSGLDYVWLVSALVIFGFVKMVYDFMRFGFSFLISSRTKKKLI